MLVWGSVNGLLGSSFRDSERVILTNSLLVFGRGIQAHVGHMHLGSPVINSFEIRVPLPNVQLHKETPKRKGKGVLLGHLGAGGSKFTPNVLSQTL